jgi:hypothetical protein
MSPSLGSNFTGAATFVRVTVAESRVFFVGGHSGRGDGGGSRMQAGRSGRLPSPALIFANHVGSVKVRS